MKGLLGFMLLVSTGYEPFTVPTIPGTSTPFNNYGVAVVLNIFDSLSDADAASLSCNYNVSLRTEDLPAAPAPTQTVTPNQTNFTVSPGDTVEFSVLYPDSNPAETTGLGLQMFFDSSKLTFEAITNVFSRDRTGFNTSPNTDASNDDSDADTDSKIITAWASLGGTWPTAGDLPATLYTVRFTASAGFTSDTVINFVGSFSSGA